MMEKTSPKIEFISAEKEGQIRNGRERERERERK